MHISGAIDLASKSAGTHPQKVKTPIDHTKNIGAKCNGGDINCRSKSTSHSYVNHAQKRDCDVRYNIEKCKFEIFFVHFYGCKNKLIKRKLLEYNFLKTRFRK